MKVKFQIGKLYKIRFYDHCTGKAEPMEIEVAGWCIKDDPSHAAFTSWQVITDDEQVRKDNVEITTILKSCILSKRKLL